MKAYNEIYHVGRIAIQILLSGQSGLVIWLTPSVTLAVQGQYLVFGISLEWLWGSINIGWMNDEFAASEKKRLEIIRKEHSKCRLKQPREL